MSQSRRMNANSIAHLLCSACLLLNVLTPLHAAVNDIFPGDYYPAATGTTTATVYAYDRSASGPYAQGRKQLDGKVDSQIMALRLTRAYSVGGLTVSPIVVLSWLNGEVSPPPLATALGRNASGMGDLRLGATVWPINDRERAQYLGLTAILMVPTGEYKRTQMLNAGENRWKLVLGGGWQQDITPQFLVELSPEVAFYGDNDDYVGKRLEQSVSYALSGYLRYRVTPGWHVFLGAQRNQGGATRINGVAQNNPAENTRRTAGMSWFLPEKQQVILRFGQDTSIANGFRTDQEVALRYQKSF